MIYELPDRLSKAVFLGDFFMRILIYKKNIIGASGGAEKAVCRLASHFAEKGCEVFLAHRDTKKGKPFFPVENVSLVRIGIAFGAWKRLIGKALFYAGLIRFFPFFDRERFIAGRIGNITADLRPDIIIAAGPADMTDITYGRCYDIPLILMLHTIPSAAFESGRFKRRLYLEMLEKVSCVQVLMPSFVPVLRKYYQGRTAVIGNAVDPAAFGRDYAACNKKMIYLSRFNRDKRQHVLIEAFAKSAPAGWILELWGDLCSGDYAEECLKLIRECNAEGRILVKGVTADTADKLRGADVCVFPSRYEGFALGLAEGMAAGLPCLGFADCSAVNEIISDGENGLLASDENDFAEKLKLLAQDSDLRGRLGRAAVKTVTAYSPEKIFAQWDELAGIERNGKNA